MEACEEACVAEAVVGGALMNHWVFPVMSEYVSVLFILYISGLLTLSLGVVALFIVEWFDLLVAAVVVGAVAGVLWKIGDFGFR